MSTNSNNSTNICQPDLKSILQSVVSRFLFREEINNMCGANAYLNELFLEDWRYVYRICLHHQPNNYDGPTVVNAYGDQCWYKEGKLHRGGDQPAAIYADDDQYWWKEGKVHRDGDQPAIIFARGRQEWWKEGNRHREGDNPAIISKDCKHWYKEGKCHREGGRPAIIYSDGTRIWCIEGKRIK